METTVVTLETRHAYDPAPSMEAFATRLFNGWGIGDAERNDGILILVLVDDRAIRIELGRGYDGSWDRFAQRVISGRLLPGFQNSDYGTPLIRAVEQIHERLDTAAAGGMAHPLGVGAVTTVALLGLLLACLAMPVGFWLWRFVPPRSQTTGGAMTRLRGDGAEAALDEGQWVERQQRSASHVAWTCAESGETRVYSYRRWFSSMRRCPACGYRTLQNLGAYVATRPGPGRVGLKIVPWLCAHCGHERCVRKLLWPRGWTHSPHHDSSGGLGGGSSSGGGASGQW